MARCGKRSLEALERLLSQFFRLFELALFVVRPADTDANNSIVPQNIESPAHAIGAPIGFIADTFNFFRRSGFFRFFLFPKALLFLFIALAGFCLAFESSERLLPEILRAALSRRSRIALCHCENYGLVERFRRVKALRDAKAGI